MAKLHIKRNPDGTWRIRGQRLAGKSLAAHEVRDNIKRGDLGKAAEEVMAAVRLPRISRQPT